MGEVLDYGLGQVLQPLQLHLEGLQLGGVPQALVVLGLHPVLGGQEDLVSGGDLLTLMNYTNSKLDGVASLVADPPRRNSPTRPDPENYQNLIPNHKFN